MRLAMTIRTATHGDLEALLALNKSEVPHVGSIDAARMEHLFREAAYFPILESGGETAGFVICMDQDADYDSLNYLWFQERYGRFFYVDRIVVSANFRRQGIAGRLYDACIARAGAEGLEVLALEYNIEPPNPVSAAFHASRGFCEVGRREDSPAKQVSMQIIDIHT